MQEPKATQPFLQPQTRGSAVAEGMMVGVLQALDDWLGAKIFASQAKTAREERVAKMEIDQKNLVLRERMAAFREEQHKHQVDQDAIANERAAKEDEWKEKERGWEEQDKAREKDIQGRIDSYMDEKESLVAQQDAEMDPDRKAELQSQIDRLTQSIIDEQGRLKGNIQERKKTIEEQWRETTDFIDKRIAAEEVTEGEAVKMKAAALKLLLKQPIIQSDDPTQTLKDYITLSSAIEQAAEDGTISQELADRMLKSLESEMFPQEKTDPTPTEELNAELAAIDQLSISDAEKEALKKSIREKFAGVDKDKKSDDNPHIKSGNDAYEAAIQLGKSEAEAEAEADKAIKHSIEKEYGEEGGTEWERISRRIQQIGDPDIRRYVRDIPLKGLTSRTITKAADTIISHALEGNQEAVYEGLADIWTMKDKIGKERFQDAQMFVNMANKLIDLKDKYGVDTGRVTQQYLDAMASGDFASAAKAFTFEFLGLEDLTDEQKAEVGSAHAYILAQFKQFLLRISGTAASDSEVAMVRTMYPNLFMQEVMNLGIIQGSIDRLRDEEFADFREESDPEFARKVMAAKGWDDLYNTSSSEDTNTEEKRENTADPVPEHLRKDYKPDKDNKDE